jgi:uncharacterized protein involved in response to NO
VTADVALIVTLSAVALMVSAPMPATQSPPVLSAFASAFASASRSVHWRFAAVVSSAKVLTVTVAACAAAVPPIATAATANAFRAAAQQLDKHLRQVGSKVVFDALTQLGGLFWLEDCDGICAA